MTLFAGLDVSVRETSVCVVDAAGKVLAERKVATEPDDLIELLRSISSEYGRIGLEAGPLSQWLVNGLAEGSGARLDVPASVGQGCRYRVGLAIGEFLAPSSDDAALPWLGPVVVEEPPRRAICVERRQAHRFPRSLLDSTPARKPVQVRRYVAWTGSIDLDVRGAELIGEADRHGVERRLRCGVGQPDRGRVLRGVAMPGRLTRGL